jgi:hypothetical protein
MMHMCPARSGGYCHGAEASGAGEQRLRRPHQLAHVGSPVGEHDCASEVVLRNLPPVLVTGPRSSVHSL